MFIDLLRVTFQEYFYDYFPILMISLFTVFECKFLWVSSEFKVGFTRLHI